MKNDIDIKNIDEVEAFAKEMNYFFTNIERVNSDLRNKLTTENLKQSDLLHELELSKLNAFEISKVAIRLRNVRKERREIKNKLELIATIKNFSDKYNNKLITKDIIILLKNLTALKQNQANRIYKTRVLEDLKISKMKEQIKGENIENSGGNSK